MQNCGQKNIPKSTAKLLKTLVGRDGIEPSTNRLKVSYDTPNKSNACGVFRSAKPRKQRPENRVTARGAFGLRTKAALLNVALLILMLMLIELAYRCSVHVAAMAPRGMVGYIALAIVPLLAAVCPLILLEAISPASPAEGRNYAKALAFSILFSLAIVFWSKVATLATSHMYPLVKWRLWRDAGMPLVVFATLVNMFVSDFFHYWFHRACHTYGWLWRFHRVHHMVREFNCLAFYGHMLGPLVQIPFLTLPFVFFFGVETPYQVAFLSSFTFAWTYFIHSNTTVNFGRLGVLFNDNAHHKMHHSVDPRHANCNFAAAFPVWDVLFGSYRAPEPMGSVRVGVSGTKSPTIGDMTLLSSHTS
jgi:sterol desaturase/sphingolipid hydroxylase (fatty acid hydroxylase superfamily)